MTKSCTCCAVAVLRGHVHLMSPAGRGLGVNDAFFPSNMPNNRSIHDDISCGFGFCPGATRNRWGV